MKKSDLKVGYVVERRDGQKRIIAELTFGLCFVNNCGWSKFCEYDEDLTNNCQAFDIVKVYGFSGNYRNALTVETSDRQLLWERKEPKKMTIKQISEALGYEVEVIDDVIF